MVQSGPGTRVENKGKDREAGGERKEKKWEAKEAERMNSGETQENKYPSVQILSSQRSPKRTHISTYDLIVHTYVIDEAQ